MILSRGSEQLVVFSASAVQLDYHISFEDWAPPDPTPRPGSKNGTLNGVLILAMLNHPGGTLGRVVKYLSVRNASTTDSNVVSIGIIDTDTMAFTSMDSLTLLPEQTRAYIEGVGFTSGDTGQGKLDLLKYVTVNSVHPTAATFANITGLTSFPVFTGHIYAFELNLFHRGDAATTGAQFAIAGVTATFITVGSMSVVVPGVATTTMSSGVATAVSTAVIAQTDSTATADVPTYIAGTIQPSASGLVDFQATSEITVAAGLTVKKGSWAHMMEI